MIAWFPLLVAVFAGSMSAEAADALLGVTVGGVLDTRGFTCTPGHCEKPAELAGVQGRLDVELCSAQVMALSFGLSLIDGSSLPLETWKSYAAPGRRVSADVKRELTKVNSQIHSGLVATGWVVVRGDSGKVPGVNGEYKSYFYRKGTDERRLTLAAVEGGGLLTYSIDLSTSAVPCSNGL